MAGLKLWFGIVGVIYLLLGIGFVPFINANRLEMMIPGFDAVAGGPAYRGILDYTFMFGLDLIVIGGFLLLATRNPLKYIPLVYLVVALEIVRGIMDDVYMISRGYSMPFLVGFIAVHLCIIISGSILAARATAHAS